MGELERHLRRAEADLLLARQAIEKAAGHVDGHEGDALQFVRKLIAQVEDRVALLRKRKLSTNASTGFGAASVDERQ